MKNGLTPSEKSKLMQYAKILGAVLFIFLIILIILSYYQGITEPPPLPVS